MLLRLCILFLCWLVLIPQCPAYTSVVPRSYNPAAALQAANILGVRSHVDSLIALRNNTDSSGNTTEEALLLRGLILRKILRAILEVRQACNKVDLELAFAYEIMRKEERHEQFVAELFNAANFAQISALYTLEPFLRIHKQFVASAICTTTSGSLGTFIATSSRLYSMLAKANHVAPPKVLANVVDGMPVDTSGMPPLVDKYLDSQAPGSDKSIRQELFAMWAKQYHVDASKKENLCGIADKKRARTKLLGSRILLLWSLHTYVQDFDYELLSLLKMVKAPLVPGSNTANANTSIAGYSPGANEVIRLLKIHPQIEELISLQKSNNNSLRRDELELLVLEKVLESALEVQVAADKVDDELNYNYHVVLADLLETRARWLQYTYEMNFLQNGVMGITAGGLYMGRFSYAGDRQFVISGGIGTGLTTLSILEMHGFWRKADSDPNSIAEILDLHPASEYRFSPFVSNFLNSPAPDSPLGKTRREILNDKWEQTKLITMNLKNLKNRKAVANMPPHKYDTIKIVENRNLVLHWLKKDLESFQVEVLDLLRATECAI